MLPDFRVGGTTENRFAEDDQFEDVFVEAADVPGRLAVLRIPDMDFFVATG